MKKGFKTTLFAMAASIAGISSSYAIAPTIKSLPDITIGDKETVDAGGTDSNFFVFTNAFRFDDHVTDGDTPVSNLVWTFVESDDPGTGLATDYYEVNGKRAVATGTTEAATLVSDPAPLHNPANNVRTGTWAEFRDIVFSPTPGTSFPNPTATHGAFTVGQHATGKTVTFYVSDGENLDSDDIIVKTVDGANDKASATTTYESKDTDDFASNANGWAPTAGGDATTTATYNSTNKALYATVTVGTGNRIIGWMENQAKGETPATTHLLWKDVAPGKVIRAKFSVFATGQANPSDKNQIPNIRLRVGSRFAFASVLEVDHHTPTDAEGTGFSQDLAPSTNPADPTNYRVDIVRPDLPYLASVAGQTEGVQRMFEAYVTANEPDQRGTIALAETSLGVYDAPLASTDVSVLKKVYNAADLANSASMFYDLRQYRRGDLQLTANNANGNNAGGSFGGITWGGVPAGQITATANGTTGLTVSTAGTPDTVVATAAVDYTNGTLADTNHQLRVRVDTDKVYAVRFYATATGASSDNALLRFRVRTAKFNYTQRLEVGNPWNITATRDATRESNILAIQHLPGTGGFAGPFDVIMNSPLSSEDPAPSLAAEPGPGEAFTGGRTTASRRDLFPAVDIIDSLSNNYWVSGTADPAEKGNVTVSKIEIREFLREQD